MIGFRDLQNKTQSMFPHLFLHWEEIIISYSFWLFFLQQLTHVKIRLPSGSCDFICKTKERKKSFQLLSLSPFITIEKRGYYRLFLCSSKSIKNHQHQGLLNDIFVSNIAHFTDHQTGTKNKENTTPSSTALFSVILLLLR